MTTNGGYRMNTPMGALAKVGLSPRTIGSKKHRVAYRRKDLNQRRWTWVSRIAPFDKSWLFITASHHERRNAFIVCFLSWGRTWCVCLRQQIFVREPLLTSTWKVRPDTPVMNRHNPEDFVLLDACTEATFRPPIDSQVFTKQFMQDVFCISLVVCTSLWSLTV
jgi:hypothetical protein